MWFSAGRRSSFPVLRGITRKMRRSLHIYRGRIGAAMGRERWGQNFVFLMREMRGKISREDREKEGEMGNRTQVGIFLQIREMTEKERRSSHIESTEETNRREGNVYFK